VLPRYGICMNGKGKVAAIVVAAGNGTRAGTGVPKQFRAVQGKPMLRHSVEAFTRHPDIDVIIVAIGDGQERDADKALAGLNVTFVNGGITRRDSVNNCLQYLYKYPDIAKILIHDAARPFLPKNVIDSLIAALDHHDGAVPALPVIDSLARSADGELLSTTENRDGLWRIQTPQAFRKDAILTAHNIWDESREATDDARMVMAAGFNVAIVPGNERLAKYTFANDFTDKSMHDQSMPQYRTGMGYDVHRLSVGEDLWLCGVKIAHDKGLVGHSDADVALHALTDAILGAAAAGDIGDHFPPSDPQWRGASSDHFLSHAAVIARQQGYGISNIDVTIICEAPKIGPHRQTMRARVAAILNISMDAVSIKATTTEKLGYTGRGEGIAAQAIATLFRPERTTP
jgi:2-C-methyl-D-erythritol 4-phosphate cytidylyltransferase / 2-C-methyl-D-erythritol 2,4-cyclodiphosphate synthase